MRCRYGLPLVLIFLFFPTLARPQMPASPPKPTSEVQALLDKAATERNAYHWDVALQLYSQTLDKAKETAQDLQVRAVEKAQVADEIIREHPYESIGIAFGVGVLLGLIVNRGR